MRGQLHQPDRLCERIWWTSGLPTCLLESCWMEAADRKHWQRKHLLPQGELIGHMPDVFQYKATS